MFGLDPFTPMPAVLEEFPKTRSEVPVVAGATSLRPEALVLLVVPLTAGALPEVSVFVTCNTPALFAPVMKVLLLMVCAPVNVLLAANCAYRALVAAVFRLSVTLPLVPPPVRSVPAVTPVIVPVPAEAQVHALPVHWRICFAAQALVRDKFSVPLVPPPIRPLPAAVVIPVIPLPPPPANTMSNSAEWLVVVLSLLSKVAFSGLFATSATPSLAVPFNHACTAAVTSTRMYWFLSFVVSGILAAIAVPSAGALLASIVLSVQVPLT